MRSSDIMIVDDEIGIRELLSEILQDEGYTVALAENAEVARQLRSETRPALVLLDIWMPGCDGISLLKEWSKLGQLNMPVVMMSGHASIDSAVEATRIGAFDFLEKPIALQKLLTTVQRALKYGDMQINTALSLDKLGKGELIQELKKQLERVLTVRAPVLLTGEPGSGFELVARFFHHSNTPWVMPATVDQLAEEPLELLQKAHHGVLFLPDISHYNRRAQQSLLFMIAKLDRFNVRIVCTMSMPIQTLMDNPDWDAKLLSVLSNIVISIPPLRDHIEDLMHLAEQLLLELIESKQILPCKLSTSAFNALRQYDWPGNLDQLRSVLINIAQITTADTIEAPAVIQALSQFRHNAAGLETGFDFNLPLRELREQLERRYFEYHIAQENGNMSRVALKVGLERTHLYRKLKQLGIKFLRRNSED